MDGRVTVWNGISYSSLAAAARANNVRSQWLKMWLRAGCRSNAEVMQLVENVWLRQGIHAALSPAAFDVDLSQTEVK